MSAKDYPANRRFRSEFSHKNNQNLRRATGDVMLARNAVWKSGLAEVLKDWVDQLESLINLFADFSAGQDDFARHEDQQDNLGLHHTVNKTRKQFRLIGRESMMTGGKTFETDGKLDVARSDNVLNLEVRELGVEAKLLNDTRVLARGESAIVL